MKPGQPVLLAALLLSTLSLAPVAAQGAYLDKGVNGFGVEARVMMGADQYRGFSVSSGYSIAGILDVGGSVGVTRGEIAGFDSTDLRVAFDYRVNVVKQSRGVPLSVQIAGSYGLNSVDSEWLDNNNLTRRGTGYTIGLNVASNIRLTSVWLLRLGLLGDYGFTTYTIQGVALPTYERTKSLYMGGSVGFLFTLPRGPVVAVQAVLRADSDLELEFQPVLSLAFPQR